MKGVAAALMCLAMLNVILLPVAGAGEAGWSAEERLSVWSPIQSNDLEIDVGENGQAIAGWSCYDTVDKRTTCWVALYDPSRGWTSGTMLGSASQDTYIQTVKINADGAAVAGWVKGIGGYALPMAAYYDPISGWKEPVQLGAMTTQIYSMDASISDQGTAMVSWAGPAGTTYLVGASMYAPASGWGQGYFQVDDPAIKSDPMCGMGEDGDALLVWREWIPVGQSYDGILRFSSYHPSTGWSAVGAVNNDMVNLGSPDVHMDVDGQGRALVAYSFPNQTTGRVDVRAAYYSGGSWLPSVQLSREDEHYSMCPDVSLTSDGRGMVLWSCSNVSWAEWQYRTFENGSYSPISSLPLPTITGVSWPYLDLSDSMHAVTTTTMKLEGEDTEHAYAALYSPSAGWSEWERVDKNCLYPIYFLVRGGVDHDGRAVVAWISNDDSSKTNRSIWASSYMPDMVEVSPPDELGALRGQLTMTLVVAIIATAIAIVSLALLFRRNAR